MYASNANKTTNKPKTKPERFVVFLSSNDSVISSFDWCLRMASFVRVTGSLFLKFFELFLFLDGIIFLLRSRSLASISLYASSFNILITAGSIFF